MAEAKEHDNEFVENKEYPFCKLYLNYISLIPRSKEDRMQHKDKLKAEKASGKAAKEDKDDKKDDKKEPNTSTSTTSTTSTPKRKHTSKSSKSDKDTALILWFEDLTNDDGTFLFSHIRFKFTPSIPHH